MKFIFSLCVLLMMYTSNYTLNKVAFFNDWANSRTRYTVKNNKLSGILSSLNLYDELVYYGTFFESYKSDTQYDGISVGSEGYISITDSATEFINTTAAQLKSANPNLSIHVTISDQLTRKAENIYASTFTYMVGNSEARNRLYDWIYQLPSSIDHCCINWTTLGYTNFGGRSSDYQGFYDFLLDSNIDMHDISFSCIVPGFCVNAGSLAIETGTYTTGLGVTKTVSDAASYYEFFADCSEFIDRLFFKTYNYPSTGGSYDPGYTLIYAPIRVIDENYQNTSIDTTYNQIVAAGFDIWRRTRKS